MHSYTHAWWKATRRVLCGGLGNVVGITPAIGAFSFHRYRDGWAPGDDRADYCGFEYLVFSSIDCRRSFFEHASLQPLSRRLLSPRKYRIAPWGFRFPKARRRRQDPLASPHVKWLRLTVWDSSRRDPPYLYLQLSSAVSISWEMADWIR